MNDNISFLNDILRYVKLIQIYIKSYLMEPLVFDLESTVKIFRDKIDFLEFFVYI